MRGKIIRAIREIRVKKKSLVYRQSNAIRVQKIIRVIRAIRVRLNHSFTGNQMRFVSKKLFV